MDEHRTNEQLLTELAELRQRVAELEASEAERKRAEEALRESEERWHALAELTSDIAYAVRVEPDGTTVPEWMTGALTRITGFTYDELIARGDWPSIIHPDDMPLALQHLQVHLSGQSDVSEYRIITKNGETRWLRDYGHPVWNEAEGRVVRTIGAAQDITERKQAEKTLRESEEKYRNLVEDSTDGIAIVQGREIKFVNQALLNMFGYQSENEMVGHAFMDFVAPNYRSLMAERGYDREKGKHVSSRYEFKALRKDGAEFDAELSVSFIVYQGSAARQGIVRDITERKQAEEALRRRAEELDALQATVLDITAPHELPTLLQTIVERAALLLDTVSGGMYLCDPDRGEARCVVSYNTPHDYTGTVLKYGEGAAGTVAQTGKPLIVDDYRAWSGRAAAYEKDQPFTAVLSVPMIWRGQVTGVIHVLDDAKSRRFTQVDLELLTLFANHAAIAVENARLYEQAQREIAERTQAEEALRETGARLQTLIQAIPDVVYFKDAQGRNLVSNRAFEELVGLGQTEIVGKTDEQLLPPDLAEYCRQSDKEAMRKHEPVRFEEPFVGADGGGRIFETIKAPLFDAQDNIVGLVGVSRDITERKQAEEALRESEHRLRSFLNNSPDTIYIYDLATHELVYLNRDEFCGYSQDELLADESLLRTVHPDDVADVRAHWQSMFSNTDDEMNPIEYRLQAQDGTWEWIQDRRIILARDVMDAPAQILATLSVITERKQMEEALRDSHEKYHSVIENTQVGILVIQDGQRVFHNSRVYEMLGYTEEEYNNIDFLSVIHPEDRSYVVDQIEQRLVGATMASDVIEMRVLSKSGDTRWVEANSVAIQWEDRPAVQAFIVDITKRKQAEEQLRRQERLAAVGQLAGGIAHDFNNLLATIILYTQMIQAKYDLPPGATQAIETVLAESRRAAKLVQQILDFSRSAMMETHPVDLVSFTEGVFSILRRTIPENIRLVLAIEPEEYAAPLTVEADPTRIQQALMNLALNARDAMPDGGELRIGLSRMSLKLGEDPPAAEMAPGKWICLAVSDTGTGMTEEVQAHLFEPFFTTKESGKGTGLGLAQVYGIVKQHKGSISAETKVGEGTTFCIYLPAYEEETEEVEVKGASALPQGRGETILVVEDEARLRTAVREILESLSYRVLTAANGQEALEVYRSAKKIDLVLADLVMPEMGGKQLIQELGREDPDLKALVITGYVMETNLQELEEKGFLGVINKPFDADRLAKMVRRTLDLDETTQR
jgi:two-component system cell cycle sensor histidine kinase/response regulator CckA